MAAVLGELGPVVEVPSRMRQTAEVGQWWVERGEGRPVGVGIVGSSDMLNRTRNASSRHRLIPMAPTARPSGAATNRVPCYSQRGPSPGRLPLLNTSPHVPSTYHGRRKRRKPRPHGSHATDVTDSVCRLNVRAKPVLAAHNLIV